MWADSSFEDLVQYNDGFKTRLIGTPEEITEPHHRVQEDRREPLLTCYLHFQGGAPLGRDVMPIVREKEKDLARAHGTES